MTTKLRIPTTTQIANQFGNQLSKQAEALGKQVSAVATPPFVSPPPDIRFLVFGGTLGAEQTWLQVAAQPDSGPIITGGFPIFNIIQRPQRVSMTVHNGYDPVTMDVPIRFDGWAYRNSDGFSSADIENDIAKLEWMYGRGAASNGGVGKPPVVTISAVDLRGQSMALVPSNWASINDAGINILYNITSIAWDPNPLRERWDHKTRPGARLRQDAVVSLQQIVTNDFQSAPTAVPTTNNQVQTLTTNGHTSLLQLVQMFVITASPMKVATAVLNSNANLKGIVRSVTAVQPAGLNIKVSVHDANV